MNYDPNIPAIPTAYKGIEMRSRLEARWAAFFDAVGLPWEYEPIMLGDWWPDFRLVVPCPTKSCTSETHTILVEIKPFAEAGDFEQHASMNYRFGEGIEEDGIGQFGRNWESAWVHLRHSTGSKVSRLFRTMLSPLCPAEENELHTAMPRWLAEKWDEACFAIRQIAAEDRPEVFAGNQQTDIFDTPSFMDGVWHILGTMKKLMNCKEASNEEMKRFKAAMLVSIMSFDESFKSFLTTEERIDCLDFIHDCRKGIANGINLSA